MLPKLQQNRLRDQPWTDLNSLLSYSHIKMLYCLSIKYFQTRNIMINLPIHDRTTLLPSASLFGSGTKYPASITAAILGSRGSSFWNHWGYICLMVKYLSSMEHAWGIEYFLVRRNRRRNGVSGIKEESLKIASNRVVVFFVEFKKNIILPTKLHYYAK